MGTTGSEVRADVIGRVVAHASKRLTSEQLRIFSPFVEDYYSRIDPADLAERHVPDLYGAAMTHLAFGQVRRPGEIRLRAYAPDLDRYGYVSPHSVVELVVEDMPFLVDSMTMELTRHGCGLHLVVHPVVTVRRDAAGEIVEILPDLLEPEVPDVVETGRRERRVAEVDERPGVARESFMHIEINRETDLAALDELRTDLVRVVGDVTAAVTDWQPMRAHALEDRRGARCRCRRRRTRPGARHLTVSRPEGGGGAAPMAERRSLPLPRLPGVRARRRVR